MGDIRDSVRVEPDGSGGYKIIVNVADKRDANALALMIDDTIDRWESAQESDPGCDVEDE